MADIEKWITINGTHIPILKGESKARAVSNFIKGKQKARKNEIRNKLKGALRNPNSPKGKELLKNTANSIMRDKNPTIRGRAKTRDEVEDERFDKYDEYAHNVAKNLRYDNRNNPLSQDELYDQAHEIAMRASLNDIDRKYGRAGTNPNRQVGVYFNPRKGKESIRRAEYKLKTEKPKRTITGMTTDKRRRADKAQQPYKEKAEKYDAQAEKYYQKMQNEKRNTAGSDNRYYSAMGKMHDAYNKSYVAEQKGYAAWRKEYDSKKKYTYKRKK